MSWLEPPRPGAEAQGHRRQQRQRRGEAPQVRFHSPFPSYSIALWNRQPGGLGNPMNDRDPWLCVPASRRVCPGQFFERRTFVVRKPERTGQPDPGPSDDGPTRAFSVGGGSAMHRASHPARRRHRRHRRYRRYRHLQRHRLHHPRDSCMPRGAASISCYLACNVLSLKVCATRATACNVWPQCW